MDSVDKKFREKEHDTDRDASTDLVPYKRYKANNGVHPLLMSREQADYLRTLSNIFNPNACLYYLAFTFVDGTDGIANGIGRHILSYVGNTLGEAEKRKKEIQLRIFSAQLFGGDVSQLKIDLSRVI
jgi:hypothetical protein